MNRRDEEKENESQRRLCVLFLVGTALGGIWEGILFPLYIHAGWAGRAFAHVALNATGDGLLVVVLYLLGWMASRDDLWYARPGARGYVILFGLGAVAGIAVESIGVRVLHQWRYTAAMPLIPWLRIGLLPVAGAVIIPRLAFAVTSAFLDRDRPQ